MKQYSLYYIPFLFLFASSCNSSFSEIEPKDNNTLNQVVRDNFGLQFLATSLHKTGLSKTLMEAGPFTLLASSDKAFKDAGYKDPAAVYMEAPSKLELISKYHILKTTVNISEIKLGLNQPLETLLGSNVYLSGVVRGKDTILTINGSRVLQADTKASNGVMQVIDRLLEPNAHKNIQDGLSGTPNLSLFYQALKSSGLIDEFKANEKFTIFAPDNQAMRNAGYINLEKIDQTPKQELKDLVEWHICKGQKFAQDYLLLLPEGKFQYEEKMLNGKILLVDLIRDWNNPSNFKGITISNLKSPLTKNDIITGTGIIHIIGRTFK